MDTSKRGRKKRGGGGGGGGRETETERGGGGGCRKRDRQRGTKTPTRRQERQLKDMRNHFFFKSGREWARGKGKGCKITHLCLVCLSQIE